MTAYIIATRNLQMSPSSNDDDGIHSTVDSDDDDMFERQPADSHDGPIQFFESSLLYKLNESGKYLRIVFLITVVFCCSLLQPRQTLSLLKSRQTVRSERSTTRLNWGRAEDQLYHDRLQYLERDDRRWHSNSALGLLVERHRPRNLPLRCRLHVLLLDQLLIVEVGRQGHELF